MSPPTSTATAPTQAKATFFAASVLLRSASLILSQVSTALSAVNPRHPLFYRSNQLARQVDELIADVGREIQR